MPKPTARRTAGVACRCLAVCFGLSVAACAMGGPPAAVARATNTDPVPPVEVRVVDENGPLDSRRSAVAVKRIEREGEGEAELVARHLSETEAVVRAPLALGNDARLLIDGPQTHEAMSRAIRAARHDISLETYIVEAAGMGERLAALLEEKRGEQVRVRLLYDSVGSLSTPRAYFDRLRAAGVAVCEFNPVNPLSVQGDSRLSLNNRDHRKVLIVDNGIAFTGGINISSVYSSSSFGRKHKAPSREVGWRDTHVVVRGPVVDQFQKMFDATWRSQGCPDVPVRTAAPSPSRSVPARAGNMAMRLIVADPAAERSEPYLVLLSAIEQARRRVWLTYGYFVPDQRILGAVQEAARRGVDVRLVLPGFSDFWAPFHAGRSHYDTLLHAGVRIFERRDALLHAKTAVIDSVWSSVGSTNLDWRSFAHNFEADLLVLDGRFAGELEQLFGLDQAASHEIVAGAWERRGVADRVLEWVARLWEYML